MANEPYDKNADAQGAPKTSTTKALENAEQSRRLYNALGDQERTAAPGSLSRREAHPNQAAHDAFGEGRDDGSASQAFGSGRDRVGKGYNSLRDRGGHFFGKTKGFFKRHKTLLLAAGIPGAGIMLFLIFLLILAGSLELPQVTQNIETYEFARVVSQFSQSAERTTDESLALQSTSDGVYSKLKARFTQGYTDIRNSTWGRLDNYRPNQVIETLGDKNGLQLRFKTSGISGRKILTGASFDGVDYTIPQVNSIAKWVPGINRRLVARNTNRFLAKSNFLGDINESMDNTGIATIIRGSVADKIIQLAGGSRAGFLLGKFAGNLTDDEAQAEATAQMYQSTEAGDTVADNATTQELAQADSAAKNTTEQEVASYDPTSKDSSSSDLENIISTGNDDKAIAAAEAELSPTLLKKTLGIADPVYAVFTPLCIVYDGSVQQSQPSIDNQTNQQENAFDTLAADADHQKTGDQTADDTGELANAIKGTAAEVGDISKSVPYARASGATVDTSTIPSAEAGADGSYNYSLYDAIGISGSSTAGKAADWITGHMCSSLTSTYTAGAVALANIIAAIVSFGGTEAGEEAAGQGALSFAKEFVTTSVNNIFSKQITEKGVTTIERSALNRAYRFAFKQGLIVGGTYGLTELAKLEVAARAGQANNGLAQNTDLVNEADSGANIEANKLEQRQLFGRPLDASEVSQADQQDQRYVDAQNASKSFAQRYFATSNSDSLLSHMAIDMNSQFHAGLLSSLTHMSSWLLKPLSSFASLLSLSGVAHATPPSPTTQHYGNVQFGWTQDEEKLIDSDNSYKTLENQRVLDSYSGVENHIAHKYAVCFGYVYNASGNGDLDPTDPDGDLQQDNSASLGTLLASGDIQRDSDGNIIDKGLCSPTNLSYDSPDPLANNPFSTNGKPHDLIFRWRLAMGFDTTLDQLINEQSVSQ